VSVTAGDVGLVDDPLRAAGRGIDPRVFVRRSPAGAAALRLVGRIVLLRLGGFVLLLAIWSAAATQFLAIQLPRPEIVWQALVANLDNAPGLALQGLQGGYLDNVVYSAGNALIAFLLGSVLAFGVGTASGRLQWVRNLSAPVLLLFGTVPDLVAAPFLLIWLGPGRTAQFIIVFFYCFVVVGIAAQNAALRLPPAYEESAATLGASSARRLLTIVVPSGLPAVIGAVRVALATSWGLQCAGELLGSERGVGRVVVLSQQLGFTAGTVAVVCLLAVIALLCDGIVTGVLRAACRWQEVKRT
jgi:ABC-type nitrate/sulfonate/bicarbonate transport system permease component